MLSLGKISSLFLLVVAALIFETCECAVDDWIIIQSKCKKKPLLCVDASKCLLNSNVLYKVTAQGNLTNVKFSDTTTGNIITWGPGKPNKFSLLLDACDKNVVQKLSTLEDCAEGKIDVEPSTEWVSLDVTSSVDINMARDPGVLNINWTKEDAYSDRMCDSVYQLQLVFEGPLRTRTANITANQLHGTYTFTNLAHSMYTLNVSILTYGGNLTQICSEKRNIGPFGTGKVHNIDCVRGDEDKSMVITWDKPTYKPTYLKSYSLHVFNPGQSKVIDKAINVRRFVATGLEPYTMYEVMVTTKSRWNFQNETRARCMFEGKPNNAMITKVETTDTTMTVVVDLTEKRPEEKLLRIEVSAGASHEKLVAVQNPTSYEVLIDELEPHKTYELTTRVENGFGWGDRSPVVSYTTKDGTPDPPTLGVCKRDGNSVSVCVHAPQQPRGKLKKWQVICVPSYNSKELQADGGWSPGQLQTTATFKLPTGTSQVNFTCNGWVTNDIQNGGKDSVNSHMKFIARLPDPAAVKLMNTYSTVHGSRDDDVRSTVLLKFPPLTAQDKRHVESFSIVVSEVDEEEDGPTAGYSARNRRQKTCSVSFSLRSHEYIAATFSASDFPNEFHLGDGKTYGACVNKPLESGVYCVYVVLVSQLFQERRESRVELLRNRKVVVMQEQTSKASMLWPWLIGASFIVVAVLLTVAIICFYKRKIKKARLQRSRNTMGLSMSLIDTNTLTARDFDIHSAVSETEPLTDPSTGTLSDSVPVPVDDLANHYTIMVANRAKGFMRQYKKLPQGLLHSADVGLLADNKNKNRFINIVPYDCNRVILDVARGECNYVNASVIPGYQHSRQYVCAQGPTQNTLPEFWLMIWQQKISVIIMVTNVTEMGKLKCETYWPTTDQQELEVGAFNLRLLRETVFPYYVIRLLELTQQGGASMLVHQYHYTGWPDHGVPKIATPLLALRRRALLTLNASSPATSNTMLVHCSAGVGRSGTFVALDQLMEEGKSTNSVNPFSLLKRLRHQRVNMIQTLEQYVFLHWALMEGLLGPAQAHTATDLQSGLIDERVYNAEFDVLQKLQREQRAEDYSLGRLPANRSKNRDSNLLPVDLYRAFLSRTAEYTSDYINAVLMHSHRRINAFILTEQPLPETVIDFWRLATDWAACAVVMLGETISPTAPKFWPDDGQTVVHGPVSITAHSILYDSPLFTVQEVTVRRTDGQAPNMGKSATSIIRLYWLHGWPEPELIPRNPSAIVSMLQHLAPYATGRDGQPVIVHCLDGVTRCGVFAALSCLLEQVQLEEEAEVFQTVHLIRSRRPQCLRNKCQYEFLYRALSSYLQTSHHYANIC